MPVGSPVWCPRYIFHIFPEDHPPGMLDMLRDYLVTAL